MEGEKGKSQSNVNGMILFFFYFKNPTILSFIGLNLVILHFNNHSRLC